MKKTNYQIPAFVKNLNKDIVCRETDESKVNIAIMTLRALGVPVDSGTTEYDNNYPMLVWEITEPAAITQTNRVADSYEDYVVDTVEEFIKIFLDVKPELTIEGITDSYNAKITSEDEIKVGCQTVNIEAFKKLVKAATERGII